MRNLSSITVLFGLLMLARLCCLVIRHSSSNVLFLIYVQLNFQLLLLLVVEEVAEATVAVVVMVVAVVVMEIGV